MIWITDLPNMSSAVYCECYRKNQTKTTPFLEKKCILRLILLEINAFIKTKIQLSYLARLGILFYQTIFSDWLWSQKFFVGMAIFLIFIESGRADICCVAGGKSEIRLIFI